MLIGPHVKNEHAVPASLNRDNMDAVDTEDRISPSAPGLTGPTYSEPRRGLTPNSLLGRCLSWRPDAFPRYAAPATPAPFPLTQAHRSPTLNSEEPGKEALVQAFHATVNRR